MSNKINVGSEKLSDPVSERMIISCLLEHGHKVLYDIDSFIKDVDFFRNENRIVYGVIHKLITEDSINQPSLAAVISKINQISPDLITKYSIPDYLNALLTDKVSIESVKPFIISTAKLSLARKLRAKLEGCVEKINDVKGTEATHEIIALAEEAVNSITSELINKNDVLKITEDLDKYLEYIATEKPNIGISSGYPLYDKAIGGGLRKPGVHLMAGRAKSGKSQFCVNISKNVSTIGVPVLYLDTELSESLIKSRWLSLCSKVPIDRIESGRFQESAEDSKKLSEVAKSTKNHLFYYFNISGMHYHEWLSIMRRWVMKYVGFGPDGKANDCVIVLDYIKTMSLSHMGRFDEWQYLGQLITDLHNFAIKYNLPIFAAAQLNREGITKEDQSVLAGSDKLIGLCSSFAIIKNKNEEDYASDPIDNGDKKIIINTTRNGKGTSDGEYINFYSNFEISELKEGKSNLTNRNMENKNRMMPKKENRYKSSRPTPNYTTTDNELEI